MLLRFLGKNTPKRSSSATKKEALSTKFQNIKHVKQTLKQQNEIERPFRVCVEGNIGAGKTTILNYFEKLPDVETYAEPINWWRNLEGHNLLDLLYKDINKWYIVFQKYVLLTRVQVQTMPPKYSHTTTQIFERSLQNNRYTFVEQAFLAGHLKPPDYAVFNKWFEWITDNINVDVDFTVYLRTSPEIVYERVKNRNRSEEIDIPFEYLQQLHEAHEKWILGDFISSNPDKLLIIDANQPLESVLEQCEENKQKIISCKKVKQVHKLF